MEITILGEFIGEIVGFFIIENPNFGRRNSLRIGSLALTIISFLIFILNGDGKKFKIFSNLLNFIKFSINISDSSYEIL